MHLLRKVLEQEAQSLIYFFGINHMEIVKNKDEFKRTGRDVIDQSRQNRFDWRWLLGLKQIHHAGSNVFLNRLQCRNKVRQEAYRVTIPFVQRQPCDPPAAIGCPFANQRRLAKSGGGGDKRQLAIQSSIKPFNQTRSLDTVRPWLWNIKFGR
nr:hypothetical protein [Planococcus glaciei]